jgi:uncharacterized protein (TIGR00661 family)
LSQGNKKILYAVLHWGLGHATRSVPLMRKELNSGNELYIASSGAAAELLKQAFPNQIHLPLPDYKITYPSASLLWNAMQNYPRVRRAIKKENDVVAKYVSQYGIDQIISDNALGAWHKDLPSILISHQLRLPHPFGSLWDAIVQKRYSAFLQHFSEFWVPDYAGEDNLSGALSHGLTTKQKIHYVGPQSQLWRKHAQAAGERFDYLFILSGPEPARSQWEHQLLELIPSLPGKVALVRGAPQKSGNSPLAKNMVLYNRINAEQLLGLIQSSKTLICRSGYSSLMDMHLLDRKAILVPTPGQPEQEYLAHYHAGKGQFMAIKQQELRAQTIISLSKKL